MKELEKIVNKIVDENLIDIVLSNSREKEKEQKIKMRPVQKGTTQLFQVETFVGKQVFHQNLQGEEAKQVLQEKLELYRQMQARTTSAFYNVIISKKGKVTVKTRKEENKKIDASHNRQKNYIINEGDSVPFLQDLGVMTKEGKIHKEKYSKFKQINRFLEFIRDVLPHLDKNKKLRIIDFGCGKSYLTFAMYYYLKEQLGYEVDMTGLDLKVDVIQHCNQLAQKYGYQDLTFMIGDIKDYEGVNEVDMVVTLHACDTATDYALAKAIQWNAKVILSVPCCQHELNGQMKSELMKPVFKYGLIKERMAALYTDALRAMYLENKGYQVQILEFIDMEHTPKNILIRGVKGKSEQKNQKEIEQLESFLHVDPTIKKLLK
ncbi:SAM-dependent methyltransferase [Aequitasia blattaphilus]|uniref:SAM-dependent methyltransferase n=1 Tax=Aequitasia blattaphilus TaxID=2949332 RepID=A0ABT1E4Q6_9FIRM|nr:SAM-dependent methyltransferase [Aequitasia blattaphilus]MCP1100808.1 SAM-dependent methyltransferase [Aequitasia blattaphilus]MCR8613448.1 SAM-dependent methyltransferase [Aequitasia blattaphilus]